MSEIVTDGETGLLADPGDIDGLRAKIAWAASHPDDMARMGMAARARYETLYSEVTNYGMLMAIYGEAIAERIKCAAP